MIGGDLSCLVHVSQRCVVHDMFHSYVIAIRRMDPAARVDL